MDWHCHQGILECVHSNQSQYSLVTLYDPLTLSYLDSSGKEKKWPLSLLTRFSLLTNTAGFKLTFENETGEWRTTQNSSVVQEWIEKLKECVRREIERVLKPLEEAKQLTLEKSTENDFYQSPVLLLQDSFDFIPGYLIFNQGQFTFQSSSLNRLSMMIGVGHALSIEDSYLAPCFKIGMQRFITKSESDCDQWMQCLMEWLMATEKWEQLVKWPKLEKSGWQMLMEMEAETINDDECENENDNEKSNLLFNNNQKNIKKRELDDIKLSELMLESKSEPNLVQPIRLNEMSRHSSLNNIHKSYPNAFQNQSNQSQSNVSNSSPDNINEAPLRVYGVGLESSSTEAYKTIVIRTSTTAKEITSTIIRKYGLMESSSHYFLCLWLSKEPLQEMNDTNETLSYFKVLEDAYLVLRLKHLLNQQELWQYRFECRKRSVEWIQLDYEMRNRMPFMEKDWDLPQLLFSQPNFYSQLPTIHTIYSCDDRMVQINVTQSNVTVSQLLSQVLFQWTLQSISVKLFSLFLTCSELDLLLELPHSLARISNDWPALYRKFTETEETVNASYSIPPLKICLKRWSFASLELERSVRHPVALSLLYEEAKRNVLQGKYVCTYLDAFYLAGVQMQATLGNQELSQSTLSISQFLPYYVIQSHRHADCVKRLLEAHREHFGKTKQYAREEYLRFVRQWPFYGSTFFRVEMPMLVGDSLQPVMDASPLRRKSLVDRLFDSDRTSHSQNSQSSQSSHNSQNSQNSQFHPQNQHQNHQQNHLFLAINNSALFLIHPLKNSISLQLSINQILSVDVNERKDALLLEYQQSTKNTNSNQTLQLVLVTKQASLIQTIYVRVLKNLKKSREEKERLRANQGASNSSTLSNRERDRNGLITPRIKY